MARRTYSWVESGSDTWRSPLSDAPQQQCRKGGRRSHGQAQARGRWQRARKGRRPKPPPNPDWIVAWRDDRGLLGRDDQGRGGGRDGLADFGLLLAGDIEIDGHAGGEDGG